MICPLIRLILLQSLRFEFSTGFTSISNSVLFSRPSPNTDLPRIVFPTRGQQVGVHTNFVQEEPLDLQYLTMILTIYVMEDVSINLGVLTSEF